MGLVPFVRWLTFHAAELGLLAALLVVGCHPLHAEPPRPPPLRAAADPRLPDGKAAPVELEPDGKVASVELEAVVRDGEPPELTNPNPPESTPYEPPLLRAHPQLAKVLPRVKLVSGATPVQALPGLAGELGVSALWLKRDDLTHPEYGGGKPRKLEFLLGAARAQAARQLITFGGVGSNHAFATAWFGAQAGFEVQLFLLPQPRTPAVRQNLLGAAAAGATLHLAGSQAGADQLARRLVQARPSSYVIPPGGTSVLGNIGFVNAGFELAQQVRDGELTEPDAVYIAMGTMGSAAGLAVGLAAAGLPTQVVAVRASSPGTSPATALRALANETALWLRQNDASFPAVTMNAERLVVVSDQLGAGYARETRRGKAAARQLREHSPVVLELTYGAKAFAGLLQHAAAGQRVVFWVTSSAVQPDVRAEDPLALPRDLRGWVR